MKPIPARLLRPQAEICQSRPTPTERDRQRRTYILEAARNIFATHGSAGITLREFAVAIGLSQTIIRRHATDIHHLFALILTQHLEIIRAAIGEIPANRPAQRRAEYRRLTQSTIRNTDKIHILLTQERFQLPPDQLEPLEQQRRAIGEMLGTEDAEATLALLDCPSLTTGQIEAMLHTRPARPDEHAAEPDAASPPPWSTDFIPALPRKEAVLF